MRVIVFFFFSLISLSTAAQVQVGNAILGESTEDFMGIGTAISQDGSRIALGARLNDGNGTNSGHVRVFDLVGSNWVQVGADIDGNAGDASGFAISLSADGSRLIIGAFAGGAGGKARVFEFISSNWVQLGSDINAEASNDTFGFSTAISADGSRIVVGATGNDGNGSGSGHARVFDYDGSNWVQIGSDIDGENSSDGFGSSVDISNDGLIVAVGARQNDGNGNNSGHIRVFELSGGTWNQVGSDIDGMNANDNFGLSVSLSSDGNRIVGGSFASPNGNVSGQAIVYELQGNAWIQIGSAINGEAGGDVAGIYTSLSDDGNRLAVGARGNDTNDANAGQIRVFEYVNLSWLQIANILGENVGDGFGEAVALSSDGLYVVGGSVGNDDNGTNSGSARVFFLDSSLPVELLFFRATRTENGIVQLSWSTASELNNQGFDVEVSDGSGNWKKIESVEGNGTTSTTSNYSISHLSISANRVFYRLKQTDFDGVFEYSNIISVEGYAPKKGITVSNYPSIYTIEIQTSTTGGEVFVIDLQGREMEHILMNGNSLNLDYKYYSEGLYFLHIHAGQSKNIEKIFISK